MSAKRAAMGILLSGVFGCGGATTDERALPSPTLPVEEAAPDPSWTRALAATEISVCESIGFAPDGTVFVVGRQDAEGSTAMLAHVTRDATVLRPGDAGLFTDLIVGDTSLVVTGLVREGYDEHAIAATYSLHGERTAASVLPRAVIGMTFEDVHPMDGGFVAVGALNPPVSGQFWARIARFTRNHTLVFERTFEEPGYNGFSQAAVLEEDVVVVGSVGSAGAYDATFSRIALTDGSVRHRGRTRGAEWEIALGVTVSDGGIRAIGLVQAAQPRAQYDASLVVWTLDGVMSVIAQRAYGEHVVAATRAITIGQDLVVGATARSQDGVERSFVVRIAPDGTDTWTEVPGPEGMRAVAVDASPAHGVVFLGGLAHPSEARCHVSVTPD